MICHLLKSSIDVPRCVDMKKIFFCINLMFMKAEFFWPHCLKYFTVIWIRVFIKCEKYFLHIVSCTRTLNSLFWIKNRKKKIVLTLYIRFDLFRIHKYAIHIRRGGFVFKNTNYIFISEIIFRFFLSQQTWLGVKKREENS